MEGQNVKKCQQKELNWNCSENKKLYTYYYAFPRDKMTPTEAVDIEYHMRKWVNYRLCRTKRNQIHQNLYSSTISLHWNKQQKIKAKDTRKKQSESKKWKNSFAERRNNYAAAKEIKTKVEIQKDHKNEPHNIEINGTSTVLN